jgi:D-glycero-D-manno-heptose 1,7-bisphosphate phosphatase
MRAVLLDRDGVINQHRRDHVTSWERFAFLPRSLEALAGMQALGLRVAVVTNQSAVGRGLMTRSALDDIHQRMLARCREAGAAIDAVFACLHAPWDGCACRKPRPGLLLHALAALNEQPKDSILVGDSPEDLRAAHAAGVPFVLVRTGRGEETLARAGADGHRPALVAGDLWDAYLAVRGWLAAGDRIAA